MKRYLNFVDVGLAFLAGLIILAVFAADGSVF